MEPFAHHVFVCDQKKPEGAPCCSARGSARVIDALRREIAKQGLGDRVQVTLSGSIGLCESGPNMIVYPEGVWYSGVQPDDVEEIVREHLGSGRVVRRLCHTDPTALRAEIEANRRKMLAAQKAREQAGALPDDFLQLVRGFQESRAVLSAIELDVFTAIGTGADAPSIASKLGTDPRATEALLNALVSLDLLEKHAACFTNGAVASRFLVAGAPDDSRAALMHTVHLWPRWSTLTACVRHGTAAEHEEMQERPESWTEAFIAAMHKNAALRASMVVRAIGIEDVRRVLDVGGGSGAYAIAFAEASERIVADILDLGTVTPIAQRHIDAAGLGERVRVRVGDLRTDPLGSGYDIVFMSAICHMLDPGQNLSLFRRSLGALLPGGRLVIQDFILNEDKTGPRTGTLFALNMLVGTLGGSTYSALEYGQWLGEAGLVDVRRIDLPGPTALMLARRP